MKPPFLCLVAMQMGCLQVSIACVICWAVECFKLPASACACAVSGNPCSTFSWTPSTCARCPTWPSGTVMQVSILGLFNCYSLASDQCILLLLQAHWNCKTALLLLCRVVPSCKVLAMLQATGVLLLLCFFLGIPQAMLVAQQSAFFLKTCFVLNQDCVL